MSALSTRRAKLGMAMLTAFVQITYAVAAPSAQPAIGTDAASILRNQIVTTFGRRRDPHLATTPKSAVDVSKLVRDRVDRRLEAGAIAVTGCDFSFTAPDGGKRMIGLLVLRYPNAVIATQRARPLTGPKRYFSNTEILTPMIVTASGDQVVLLFTESAGDAATLSVLATTAARLRR